MSDTPELDRQAQIIASGKAETIQEFVDWLGEAGYVIETRCTSDEHDNGRYCRSCGNVGYTGQVYDFNKLMAEHFAIDLNLIEKERRMLLSQIGNSNLGRNG